MRNLDLIALLSFSVSLWFFNRGNVFASAPLAYPPLLYLIGRGLWIGFTGRATRGATVWPVWVLLAATRFGAGFRDGFNVRNSNVIDVGYSGVIGAERIVHGEWPYGHMPDEGDAEGVRPGRRGGRDPGAHPDERSLRVGESARRHVRAGRVRELHPGLSRASAGAASGTTCPRRTRPSSRSTCSASSGSHSSACASAGPLFAATLAFAWTAYPFTQYASSSNTNDALLPAFLIWGFWLVTSPWARGAFAALAGWTKFAALLVAPMWVTYRLTREQIVRAAGGVRAGDARGVLDRPARAERRPRRCASSGSARSPGRSRASRRSRSGTGASTTRGASRTSKIVQRSCRRCSSPGALVFAFVPRRKTPLQLAALTGVLLLGFELVLTHWSYLYIPWFFPFVAYAMLARRREPEPEPRAR